MSTLDLHRTIDVPIGEAAARQRVSAYLRHVGYTEVAGTSLQFSRGSLAGTMTSFSPRKWMVTASVTTATQGEGQTCVEASFSVNTTGQWVTAKERAVWEAELDSFVESVKTGSIETQAVDRAMGAAKGNTLRAILVFLGVAFVVGIGLSILLYAITHKVYSVPSTVVGILAGYLVLQRYFGVGRGG